MTTEQSKQLQGTRKSKKRDLAIKERACESRLSNAESARLPSPPSDSHSPPSDTASVVLILRQALTSGSRVEKGRTARRKHFGNVTDTPNPANSGEDHYATLHQCLLAVLDEASCPGVVRNIFLEVDSKLCN
eukprot:CAMPEP_0201499060 /NCGR_PEP_ID=MMETSP0151_2-20130828/74281_1 /ASSEMBLY_ACC=CAM_ASM_000257 /TAXON_ID=200890 /ORGANISM="Paramoeba atlantica, Strain 621/1 / CCAP 1560/9" /LENGTH=131 /DNA_ID=CAMNT_0047891093 /DNA_START=24 /DNA_END=416 /DNA_ORIENTATION=-